MEKIDSCTVKYGSFENYRLKTAVNRQQYIS
jgi:hypothetical protein